MQKLKLDLDSLDVLSFEPASSTGSGGTVAGHAANLMVTEYPCRSVHYGCYTYYCVPSQPCPTH
ncbi:MAG TPA: hypothetical protein VEX86_23530 [Longimicrobium sp.]|nr:hypothetical protein [Longimicrobium sp.]